MSPSAGGLATGLASFFSQRREVAESIEYYWVGWPGIVGDTETGEWRDNLIDLKYLPVFYNEERYQAFYVNLCNQCLWPLFHSWSPPPLFEDSCWLEYQSVNKLFFDRLAEMITASDMVWVHDFHLMLLPGMLRNAFPKLSVGFFLHIPFPPLAIFKMLPKNWRESILNGLLGANLVGFHTNHYVQDFKICVTNLLRYDVKEDGIVLPNRFVQVDSFPMGIDFQKFHRAIHDPIIVQKRDQLKRSLNSRKLVLSVDRLDYIKGILNRLEAFEKFLSANPVWHCRVSLVLIVVPSRTDVPEYKKLKELIDERVGRINGNFSKDDWIPINYQFKSKTFEDLVALYSIASVALITPLRDGMNLVAKEYVASRLEADGVLVLSEMAGASEQLVDAMVTNPFDAQELSEAIKDALEMPLPEQQQRMANMQRQVSQYDVIKWGDEFLNQLASASQATGNNWRVPFTEEWQNLLKTQLKNSTRAVIILDYDGTLVRFEKYPELAFPSTKLLDVLKRLSELPNVDVVLASGRDRTVIDNWFQKINIMFVAENGVWSKCGDKWKLSRPLNNTWKPEIIGILENYKLRLPGSSVEEKEYSIVWHYRHCELPLIKLRLEQFLREWSEKLAQYGLRCINEIESIEIRPIDIDKKTAVVDMIQAGGYDLICYFGDDHNDELAYKALPDSTFTFNVGFGRSSAKFHLKDSEEVKDILMSLLHTADKPTSQSTTVRNAKNERR